MERPGPLRMNQNPADANANVNATPARIVGRFKSRLAFSFLGLVKERGMISRGLSAFASTKTCNLAFCGGLSGIGAASARTVAVEPNRNITGSAARIHRRMAESSENGSESILE